MPRVKRNRVRKENTETSKPVENQIEDDVEKKSLERKIQCSRNYGSSGTQSFKGNVNSDDQFEQLLSSPMKQAINLKPLSFWSKKLQDLESDKNVKPVTKLYEFSASEDSFKPSKEGKKTQRKYATKKKKQPIEFPITQKKTVKVMFKSKAKEFIAQEINKENAKSLQKNNKCITTNRMPPHILTSTPAPNKTRTNDMENLAFLSPIEKRVTNEQIECDKDEQIHDKYADFTLSLQTPKALVKRSQKERTKESSNLNYGVRVLRNRKVLIQNNNAQ
ncbi:hypothetical protein RUM43_008859 [Polyplax serrata]|uniref:Uncharacterized protein n=1 Tax=Polyplax serrata TaxID=468196 RepID=A0AAN8NV01_POLSC